MVKPDSGPLAREDRGGQAALGVMFPVFRCVKELGEVCAAYVDIYLFILCPCVLHFGFYFYVLLLNVPSAINMSHLT